ncbi:thioester domain-containing protein [Saccharothrix coeruleofusca]|uniref:TQXA domain-containing protein n=1 Tax=Saccharothrix coeruleofusca TaxID=33919 RepID=A0A918AK23_9PSEU|nr:thioester domain-containing protein [Saccharothrix coeruleofusca]GGP36846.1 TQXA domain-containing protein [Saccharothrix coeruleofusca]
MASRNLTRIGAAILGASLAMAPAALPAFADTVKVEPDRGAGENGLTVNLDDRGKHKSEGTSLIGLKITEGAADTRARAYCVELPTPLKDGTPLSEVPWDQHPNEQTKFKQNSKFVNWILHNSYPQVKPSVLGEKTGKDIDAKEAITATQAAIWHYTDGAVLREDATDKDKKTDEDVFAVYKYLTGAANTGIDQEPSPTLSVAPESLSGKAGELIGPFTVTTTADKVVLKADLPQGVKLTDKNGTELATAKEGEFAAQADVKTGEVYVSVAQGTKPGKVEFSVEANAELRHGRLFVSSDRNKKTQSLIIATPSKVKVEVGAKADWAEAVVPTTTTTTEATTTTTAPATTTTEATTSTAPTTTTTTAVAGGGENDDLASTGASIFVPLLIGLGLVGAGAATIIVMRRRKTA